MHSLSPDASKQHLIVALAADAPPALATMVAQEAIAGVAVGAAVAVGAVVAVVVVEGAAGGVGVEGQGSGSTRSILTRNCVSIRGVY